MNAEDIEQMFAVALSPIPVEPDVDQIKSAVLETCRSPIEMDIAQMRRGLEKWGFKITEYERLTDDRDRHVLQEYMVWIDSSYGIELARTNIGNWLQEMPTFPWIGRWDFVVKYSHVKKFKGDGGNLSDFSLRVECDFTVRVRRWSGGLFNVHGVAVKVPWADRRREIMKSTAWQRPLIYG